MSIHYIAGGILVISADPRSSDDEARIIVDVLLSDIRQVRRLHAGETLKVFGNQHGLRDAVEYEVHLADEEVCNEPDLAFQHAVDKAKLILGPFTSDEDIHLLKRLTDQWITILDKGPQ
jgi:hypothetical protein